MFAIAFLFVRVLCDGFKSRRRLEAEILVLRHQLNVLQQRAPRRLYLSWANRACFTSKADTEAMQTDVRFGPKADIAAHSITSSARNRNASEIFNPMALAALRFTTNSNFAGRITGRSAALSPFRTLPT